MLKIEFCLLAVSAVGASVLTPVSNLFPNIAQDGLATVNASLGTKSSELLNTSSFTTITTSLSITNSSLPADNDLSADVMVRCDGHLGYNLNINSCVSAFRTIHYSDARSFIWGPRGVGVRFDFPLPRRWVSSELFCQPPRFDFTENLSGDGTCIIEAILFEAASAEASLLDVARAASGLIIECVEKRNPTEGGLARDFGRSPLLLLMTMEDLWPIRRRQ